MTDTNNCEPHHALMPDATALETRIETTRKPGSRKRRGPHVLVVDGAEPACRFLRLAPDQIEHRCLIIYVQLRPVCVVLDLDAHGAAALDVCRTIRQQPDTLDTTILWLTASRSVHDFDAALLAGADEILLKPLADGKLLARVEHALKLTQPTGAELRWRCEQLCKQRAVLEAGA